MSCDHPGFSDSALTIFTQAGSFHPRRRYLIGKAKEELLFPQCIVEICGSIHASLFPGRRYFILDLLKSRINFNFEEHDVERRNLVLPSVPRI